MVYVYNTYRILNDNEMNIKKITTTLAAIALALSTAVAAFAADIPCSLYTFLQILEVNLFEKKPISSLVAEALKRKTDDCDSKQLNLFSY
jgi:hypothetical protein